MSMPAINLWLVYPRKTNREVIFSSSKHAFKYEGSKYENMLSFAKYYRNRLRSGTSGKSSWYHS